MHDLRRWLRQLTGKRLLVLGDPMLDRYLWGDAERISPEAPVMVLREDLDEVRPGGAANVASFLRGLNCEAILAGVIGNDADGRTLLRLMHDLSVDVEGVIVDSGRQTTCKQRFVGRTAQRQPHQILRVDRESRAPIGSDIEQQLQQAVLSALEGCDALLISDYGKGVCTPWLLRLVINEARRQSISVLVDPCRTTDYERYRGACLVTPNRVAAELAISRSLRDPGAYLSAAAQLREQFGWDAAAITLDREGMAYATADDAGLVACRPRDVCDVTGAGDMVLAMVGLCLASGVPLVDSLQLGNCAAGLEVEQFGVVPISLSGITRELDGIRSNRKVISLEEMMLQVTAYRRNAQSIVLTNGCFDLLHVGHVSLLEEASRMGDVLIVAINSDASVRKLKETERPIIGQDDRARMLGALACVDHVLIFDDDTPHRLLEAIRPDILVKGGTTGHIVGREIVEAYGGRVAWTPPIAGFSTTQLVQRLRSPEPLMEVPS